MTRKLVVIPAHNEEDTIREVVMKALCYADVSVTDDGSCDRTPVILSEIQNDIKNDNKSNRLNIITHPMATHIPLGIQDGLKYGIKMGYDYIVTMDAGLSHNPDTLPVFFESDPMIDIVIGSREHSENVPLYRKMISRIAALVVNYSLTDSYLNFLGARIKDCTSGYRRYSFRAVRLIAEANLKSKAFDFHIEALAMCVRAGMKVSEIPIHYTFSNSTFNSHVLKHAIKFACYLLATKKHTTPVADLSS